MDLPENQNPFGHNCGKMEQFRDPVTGYYEYRCIHGQTRWDTWWRWIPKSKHSQPEKLIHLRKK